MTTRGFQERKRTRILAGLLIGALALVGFGSVVRATIAKDDAATVQQATPPTAATPDGGTDLTAGVDSAAVPTAAPAMTEATPPTDADPTPAAATPQAPVKSLLGYEPSRYWEVTGVDEDVNVRLDPGTDMPVIATLPLGTTVLGGGTRVDVDGVEWKLLVLDSGEFGWAAGPYLTPAPNPRGVSTDWTCWLGDQNGFFLTLLVDEGTVPIDGLLRYDAEDGATFEYLRFQQWGEGGAEVLRSRADNTRETSSWTVTGDAIALHDGLTVRAVDCDDVAGWVNEMVSLLWATE